MWFYDMIESEKQQFMVIGLVLTLYSNICREQCLIQYSVLQHIYSNSIVLYSIGSIENLLQTNKTFELENYFKTQDNSKEHLQEFIQIYIMSSFELTNIIESLQTTFRNSLIIGLTPNKLRSDTQYHSDQTHDHNPNE